MNKVMNFLFTTWEGGGNVTPAVEVARKLVKRGHVVRFMSEECNRTEAESVGAKFVPWRKAPNRSLRTPETELCRDWAAATPQEGLLSVIRDVWCGPSLAYAEDLLAELKSTPADLVVTNEALFGVMAACESSQQQFVLLCPNISLAPIPGIPPIGPGLPPARNDAELAMHSEIEKALHQLFDSGIASLNKTRHALGLKQLDHVLEQFSVAAAELLATSKSFDFPAKSLPDRIRYVGPQLGQPKWAKPWQSPWSQTDERPLVTVSFSTTFQNHATILQKVVTALEALPVRVLLTLGGSINAQAITPTNNCVIVESAPHSAVMKESALAITHGGHGTVMQALVNKLPLLVIPHGRDQNDNAVRVTERGAGLSLLPDATTEEIIQACSRLLTDVAFKESARKLGTQVEQDAINSDVVEQLESFGTRSPNQRSTADRQASLSIPNR